MNPRVFWPSIAALAFSVAHAAPNPALTTVPEDPKLPRVLLIGDSISIAYTLPVRERLSGRANVQRIPVNGGPTISGLSELDAWLATGGKSAQDWDVIHFNWGLHDLCYRLPDQPGSRDKANGKVSVTPEQYGANLESLVQRLKKTGAKLIFATTTPVPDNETGRKVGDDIVYNQVATSVMQRHGVTINDLHAVMAGNMGRYAVGPGNVHFNDQGSALLADKVAEAIQTALNDGFSPLFDGKLSHWQADEEGGWVVDPSRALTCTFKEVKAKDGQMRKAGRGYLWTRQAYEDFELRLSYKLSEATNSGVFFRTDPKNPVQGGFEIQLMDDAGFQKTHPTTGPRNLNGALNDAVAPAAHPVRPVGQWNELRITCQSPRIRVHINGKQTVDANISEWTTPERNPDGSPNKFKTALAELPRTGRIGLQNHGDAVWFKDIFIKRL
jgi:hypothetical protein